MQIDWDLWATEVQPAIAKLEKFPSFISVEKVASAFMMLPDKFQDIPYDDLPGKPASTEALRNLFCVLPLIENYNYTIVVGDTFATLNLFYRHVVSFVFDNQGHATNSVQHRVGNTLQWGGTSKRYKLPADFPRNMEALVRTELGQGFERA